MAFRVSGVGVLAVCAGLSCAAHARVFAAQTAEAQAEPIQVGFLWHMHQPRYVPGETIFGADAYFSYSVIDIHNQRTGPYTSWPKDAIDAGSSLAHLGAQVSFSGSLIENLDELEAAGVNGGLWSNWDNAYRAAQSNTTSLGNRRLEMVAFGYHHPLMPLLDERSVRLQIQMHKLVYGQAWGGAYSRGMFPPETAFSERIIPALVAEGIDWVLVDNIHFDRACEGYPYTPGSNIYAPNRADQVNPDPSTVGGSWVQLNNLWAPSLVSAPFGYQPHYVQHVDPETGAATRMIAVPAARYEGNEDARGGYGAFLYDQVMDAYLPENNAADRPMFVVLHHDGDNYGGGSDAYYHANFQNMVAWAASDPDYEVTTVNDYLDRFPVPTDSLIHVEDGSWAGADAGDPEFKKWLGGDTSAGGVCPDVNSWAVVVAATNVVRTLDDLNGGLVSIPNIVAGTGAALDRAWHYLLSGQASDYWYWDGTEVWDSNPTRAANLAVAAAEPALASAPFVDATPPTVFVPQREPYNPGSIEWGPNPESSDFEVWTLAYDRAGLASVTLKWRTDADGVNPIDSVQNETYAGGPEVGPWQSVAMTSVAVPTPSGVLGATVKARRYAAMVTGQQDVLIDYYVEAVDSAGNVERTDIRHVWVGDGSAGTGGGGGAVAVTPDPLVAGETATITYDPAGGPLAGAGTVLLHYGFDDWQTVVSPDPAMADTDGDGVWEVTIPLTAAAGQLDFVFNNGSGVWDNNNGQDWHAAVTAGQPVEAFEMDGQLDAEARLVSTNAGVPLWAAVLGDELYLATSPASGGRDRFIVLAQTPGSLTSAMWAKAGAVAAWDAFLGNEESNGFVGWFDQQGAARFASGAVLECTISLAGEFGPVPEAVHAAVLSYATQDGGALQLQTPASADGNADADASEFAEIRLCALRGDCCPADITGDGALNNTDINAFVTAFLGADPAADMNADGSFNNTDINLFVAAFLSGCG